MKTIMRPPALVAPVRPLEPPKIRRRSRMVSTSLWPSLAEAPGWFLPADRFRMSPVSSPPRKSPSWRFCSIAALLWRH